MREIDWKYEGNNNSKLDNGVYNKFANNSGNGANLSDSSTPSEYAGLDSARSSNNLEEEKGSNPTEDPEEQIKE